MSVTEGPYDQEQDQGGTDHADLADHSPGGGIQQETPSDLPERDEPNTLPG